MRKIRSFVRPFYWLDSLPADFPKYSDGYWGWGCGYVVVPPDHPVAQGKCDPYSLPAHGGITCWSPASELDWPEIKDDEKDCFILGFDTAHGMESPKTHPKEWVEQEAQRIARLVEELYNV